MIEYHGPSCPLPSKSRSISTCNASWSMVALLKTSHFCSLPTTLRINYPIGTLRSDRQSNAIMPLHLEWIFSRLSWSKKLTKHFKLTSNIKQLLQCLQLPSRIFKTTTSGQKNTNQQFPFKKTSKNLPFTSLHNISIRIKTNGNNVMSCFKQTGAFPWFSQIKKTIISMSTISPNKWLRGLPPEQQSPGQGCRDMGKCLEKSIYF